ncbi:amidohydrolase family protein [Novosphingobium bradum]|uniref:Amidohydrolase family protein n=1 Tax=Novosphingobium bradum TaxID=1737444 RepID=A0ABV7IPK5_9SPHN
MAFDLIIRGGRIVDGSGQPARTGDVAVKDGWIVAVGQVQGPALREIDATGLLVTPGFVDLHTHYDGQVIWSDRLAPSSDHGVTTILTGNCGIGFAPCRRGEEAGLIALMEGVEDIPEPVAAAGLTWDWETFPEYMAAIERRPHDIDVAVLVPHSPLRTYVMGQRGVNREAASEADIAAMQALVVQALEAGALGFGTSRSVVHRTPDGAQIPSYEASNAELLGIAAALAQTGKGLFQIVPNFSSPQEFAVVREIARATAGRPVTYTQGQPMDPNDDFLPRLEASNAEPGVIVRAQMLPRPFGMIGGLTTSSNPFSMLPSFQPLKALPLAQKVAALRDPALRAALLAEQPDPGDVQSGLHRRWGSMYPLDPANMSYEPGPSESVAARAAAAGVSPADYCYDLLLERDGNQLLLVALGNYRDSNLDFLERALGHKDVVVGLGDGGAHYGFICDASYPTHALAWWTRDRPHGRFSIEQMVNMLSRRTAVAAGLHDRGLIAPGHRADINLIDHAALKLHAPEVVHDLPAGGMRLHQRADGYVATIVAGEIIAQDGVPTAARPGRLVRGAQAPRLAA